MLWAKGPPHTTQTQTNSQLPLSNHSVASRLTRSASLRHAASSTVACTFCICATCNKRVTLHENRKWQNGVHRKTKHTQYSAPLTHRADSLAHNQSENPMAQTADSQPPQTSHVESEQTSARLRKLPTQLNTPNVFVSDHVRVSPNASDSLRLGRCVPALKGQCVTI